MARSTKDDWLGGPGDLVEADVEDVPVKGSSVRVRALSAKWSAEVQSQMKIMSEGTQQVGRVDVPAMERLQWQHGCIDPTFSAEEAAQIQNKYGPAFRKVIAKIDEISGIDKEAVETRRSGFKLAARRRRGNPKSLDLPATVPDQIFLCELALELKMPIGELTSRMSAHELGVIWPLYFQHRRDEQKRAQREADMARNRK